MTRKHAAKSGSPLAKHMNSAVAERVAPVVVGIPTLSELIDRKAHLQPDVIAIRAGHESISYRNLIDRANQLANWLISLGVMRDVPIGIALPRSIDALVAMLAVWKAGGAYMPLDATYPVDRLALMLED